MSDATAVLISIRPKWAELIVNGQKTLEVRKNRRKPAARTKATVILSESLFATISASILCHDP